MRRGPQLLPAAVDELLIGGAEATGRANPVLTPVRTFLVTGMIEGIEDPFGEARRFGEYGLGHIHRIIGVGGAAGQGPRPQQFVQDKREVLERCAVHLTPPSKSAPAPARRWRPGNPRNVGHEYPRPGWQGTPHTGA